MTNHFGVSSRFSCITNIQLLGGQGTGMVTIREFVTALDQSEIIYLSHHIR